MKDIIKINKHLAMVAMTWVAVAMASCDDTLKYEEPIGQHVDNEVRLQATVGDGNWQEMSRANKDASGVSIISFSSGDKMVVDAWYLPNGATQTSTLPDFMRRQEMTYDGTKWNYTPVKYWPNNPGDRLIFWAYNLDGYAGPLDISDNDPITGYPVFSFGKINYMHDVLVSEVKIAEKPSINGLELPMKHIMAYVQVKARVSTRDGSDNIHGLKITEIRFNNEPQTATFTGFDSNGDPIWKNVSIFPYSLATPENTGSYVKVAGQNRYIEVGECKGVYALVNGTYEKRNFANYKRNDNGDYIPTTRGNYVLENGTYVEVEDEAGTHINVGEEYVPVEGPGTHVSGNATSILSREEVVLPATGDWVDMPDAGHLVFPCKLPNIAANEPLCIFLMVDAGRKVDDGSVGSELGNMGYGYKVFPEGELKGGYITTFYITLGLRGIENIETETRPWTNWSGDKVNLGVEFGK